MKTRHFVLPVALIAFSLARVDAQTEPAAPEEAMPAVPVEPQVTIQETHPAASPAVRGRDSAGKDTLSVDFPDEEIRNILRNVADLFELNLVIPETLQGKASIKLRDVTWRQIFQVVLAPVGYTYIEEGNIIKIVANETLLQEPVATEVFVVNYARAADIMPTITSLVDPAAGGKIVVDARTNSLVITERPSRMNRIRPIIEQLDRATDQVMIESKFVEVTDRDIKNLGVNWTSLSGYGISAGGLQQKYTRGSGHEHSTTHGEKNIDVPFMENGYERADTLASRNNPAIPANVPGSGIGPAYDPETGEYKDIGPTSDLTTSFTNDLSRLSTAVFDADQFKLVLSALQTQNKTKIVSNPTIVTLNNTEATINVGEERPIPNYTFSEQTGTFQISGFTYKPIGVLLRVTPQVNRRGLIKLTLAPEVSQTNGQVTFGGASGTQIPIVATRKALTQVSIRDGYTMALGGLVAENGTKGESKVPVLGSVPVLGRLFRSNTRDITSSNLIIFITAKSISAEGAPVEEIFNSEKVRQLEIKREDLPGYRDGSDPYLKPETKGQPVAAVSDK
ncbi:MAG TPA: secretin N-terminal domain-containing protein [Opitutus sp.]|nr:secretin N-terminal domain-containing protein [Opitutus sp.]